MMRNLLLSSVAGLAALLPLATPASARADHVLFRDNFERHHHRFEVIYRRDCRCPWQCYGSFSCFEDAEHAARHLRHQGFEVSIRD
jgi:hypothetical protein